MALKSNLEVGKIYAVDHSRKGRFSMRVTRCDGEWTTGIIVNGTSGAMMSYNFTKPDGEITVRNEFCTFTEKGGE